MHNGACIAEGPLDRVTGDPRVIEAYLGVRGAALAAGPGA
jgi:ABC-type branched-subunit amino acid transport system ATPase component